MALTNRQIITLACQIAKTQGMRSQAGLFLNAILSDLCQTYDFDKARGTTVFNFNPSLLTTAAYPNIQPGGGPYDMPDDYLRLYGQEWFLQGVPYPMIPCDLKEYDQFVQQAGLQSYPTVFATDMSQTPPVLVVWPPASGAYQCMVRYYRQMPAIATPESSDEAPWFENTGYLIEELAGKMMKISGDDRAVIFAASAADMLTKYLKLVNDKSDRAQSVKLDRRRFSRPFTRLPNTKQVGW